MPRIDKSACARFSYLVIHFGSGFGNSSIYLWGEWVSSVILTSQMHDTNTVEGIRIARMGGSN